MRPSIASAIVRNDPRYVNYVQEGQEHRVDVIQPSSNDNNLEESILDWIISNVDCPWSLNIKREKISSREPVPTSKWVCTYSFSDLQTAAHFRLKF